MTRLEGIATKFSLWIAAVACALGEALDGFKSARRIGLMGLDEGAFTVAQASSGCGEAGKLKVPQAVSGRWHVREMKTRIAVAPLIGLMLAGSAGALFATPPAVADPRDGVTLPPPARLAAPPASAPKAESLPSGNPLWSISLSQLSATVARPVFSPSRRPPPPAVANISRAAPPPPPPKLEPEKPQLSLVGTVVAGTSGGIGLFEEQGARTVLRLKKGDDHKGWVLRIVQRHEVVLEKGFQKVVLTLPPPDTKKMIGPGGIVMPMAAAPASPPHVPAPAGAEPPQPPSPAGAGQPPAATGAGPPPPAPTGASRPPPPAAGETAFSSVIRLLRNQ